MKPENAGEISKRYWIFFAYFLSLLCLSLVCILFLFKTHRDQLARMSEEEERYNTIQNQQFVLSGKIDSLVSDMRQLSGQGENNAFLINNINVRRLDLEQTYRNTDTSQFLVYGHIISQIRPALVLKDSIAQLNKQESFTWNALNACINSFNRARQQQVNYNSERFRSR